MVVIQIGSLLVARQHELPVLHNTLELHHLEAVCYMN